LGRYALRLCRDEGWAADAVQETFLRLCRADWGAVEGRLAEWLFTVCRSRVFDRLRKEGRMSCLGEADARLAASGADPAGEAERRERGGRVLAAAARLPEREREAVRLKFQEGLDYRQIARVIGATENHVGVLIHRGVATLRRQLAERA
jgi:RNA polymerase sigma-70 factor (ECF subfamily)